MSKQSEAKKRQGYDPKPIFPMCSNCEYYRSIKTVSGFGYVKETQIRCGYPLDSKAYFAVKKTATCDHHEFKREI